MSTQITAAIRLPQRKTQPREDELLETSVTNPARTLKYTNLWSPTDPGPVGLKPISGGKRLQYRYAVILQMWFNLSV